MPRKYAVDVPGFLDRVDTDQLRDIELEEAKERTEALDDINMAKTLKELMTKGKICPAE